MDSYEKGIELEELVTKIFKAKGYDAKHNIKLTGRSGVTHQIDVYAEYKAPLHLSRIIIECKSYDKPIDKDIVMKLIHEVEDLGVDRGILVTTSYFTPDAVSTAKQHNIDLWDGVKLRDLLSEIQVKEVEAPSNIFYVTPSIPMENARERMIRELKGVFRHKGEIESSFLVFYPYYEIDISAGIYEKEGFIRKKSRKKIVNATILVDGLTGQLCEYDDKKGISRILKLPELSEEEMRVFQILSHSALTVPALASMLSCSTSKARRIVQGLVAKGVAEQQSYKRQTFYKLRIKVPDLLSLKIISSNLKIEKGEPEIREGYGEVKKISPELSLDIIGKIVTLLWKGVINNYKVIFYPYHASEINEDGKKYIKVIDLMTGKIDEKMGRTFTLLYFYSSKD